MADIASGDVTYSLVKQRKEESGNKVINLTVAFGNSSLTYPSGGIPLLKSKMGCPNQIVDCIVESANPADGIVYKYDKTNNKIRMYRSAGFTPAGTNSKPSFTVEASGAIGTNMEVGLSADSAAATFEGGVGITAQRSLTTTSPVGIPTFTGTAVAAGNMVELVAATTAVVAATLNIRVTGW